VFSSGAHAAVVEIERATGRLAVLRMVAVDDAGTLINPLLAHGQVIGGIAQTLGQCLTEEVVHDELGQLQTASLLDYSLVTAAEMPPLSIADVQTPSPLNPLGAKGVGEGGTTGSLPAIANAVADALGGRHVEPPFTEDKLWRALRAVPA
jgi:carbon-monoxide dehydrogenase large subunit